MGWAFIKGLTISLQGQSKDICCAYNEIVPVKEALSEVSSNIDTCHKKLYDSVVSLGGKINTLPPSLQWRCTHQTNRENVSSNTPEEYLRRAITIPFFDDMISHLNNTFSDVQRKAIMALSIVPSVLMIDQEADSSLEEELIEHYHDDLLVLQLYNKSCICGSANGSWLKKADFQTHLHCHLNMLMSPCFQTFIYFCHYLYIACDK